MKILIVGAGSIGVYLGTLLNKQHDVTLLGREKLKNINDTIYIKDDFLKIPKRVYAFPKEQSFDMIFITSKLYDFENNLKGLSENNLRARAIISIQNGLVDNEPYKKYFGEADFTSISVFEGFRLLQDQLIVNQSESGWKTDTLPLGLQVSELLLSSGIQCFPEKNLEIIKAEKTIMNCSLNALSAIERKTFFELFRDERTHRMVDQLFDESYGVLSKKFLLRDREILRKIFYNITENMKHYSSTYQDAISGRKTEIEFLNSFIVELGEKLHINTPMSKQVVHDFYKKYPPEVNELRKNLNREIKLR